MSEAPKTVEEPVVAPTTTTTETPAVVEPTTEVAKPAETVEPATETPAPATTEAAKEEEVAAPVKEEVKPVEEGVLGYKGPGLLKSFIFQKKFFWFGTDAVEPKALGSYLRGEKDTEAANHNAAWASKTGNGLLFFSKKATDKASPAGIFNLSDVTNIANEGTVEFHFTSGGHKHTFQAGHLAERDNWVAVLKAKVEEAKTVGETIKESEEYKKSHSALTKPAVVAAAVPTAKKVEEEKKEEKKEEKAEAKEEKKEEKAEEKKEEKKARKSRSASRKRVSIFGGFGKKEEKVAEPKEKAVEPKEETVVAPIVPAAEEPVVEATPAATEAPAAVEPVVPAAEEPVSPTTEAAKPTPTKRNSIFGTLKSQFSQHKEKKAEEAPVVPAKDTTTTTEPEPVSETAPVIPQVESTEPLATSVEAAAPAEIAPVTNGETKAAETPAVKSDKRKSSLPWLTKKEKPTSDEEGEKEKPKSPFAKLRATVKGKSSPKTEKVEKTEAKKEEEAEAAPAEPAAPATEEPIVAAPVPAVATTPQVTASA